MAKPKKSGKKPSVKVNDLDAKENPKGGAYDAFLKIEGIKGEATSRTAKSTKMTL